MKKTVRFPTIIYLFIFGIIGMGAGCQGVSEEQLRGRMEQVLYEAAADEEAQLRCHALESMAEWGGTEAADWIRMGLDDPTPAVRFAAAVAAGDIQDQQSRSALERLLHDEISLVRLGAVYGLEKLGDQRFDNWYDEALNGDDVQLAGLSCMLLGKLGHTALRTDSREKLRRVLNRQEQQASVKLQATEALARLGDETVLRRLLSYSASGYADDRLLAIAGLEQLSDEDAYRMLLVLADDMQIEVQLAAVRALGMRAEEEHVDLARQGLRYVDENGDDTATARVRGLAALALGRVGRQEDGRRLYQALRDRSVYVRIAAVRGVIDYLRQRDD